MKAETRAASARAARVANSMAVDMVGLQVLKQRRTRYLRGREEDHHRRRGWCTRTRNQVPGMAMETFELRTKVLIDG